jgi:DNA-binding NarL/FixJ family response regulator
MGGPVTIVVADDHAATRAGIRAALEPHGFAVLGEAATAPAAIDAALRERPDACLLDVEMPGGGGIAAAAAIAERLPGTAVVMLTVSADEEDLFAALKAGASGYLLKDMDAGRLPAAVRGVLAGEAAIPRTLVARMVDALRTAERRPALPFLRRRGVQLTSREWEVLEQLREERSTGEIAARLGVSPVTVRRHVSALLAKLRVPDRRAMLDLIESHGGR